MAFNPNLCKNYIDVEFSTFILIRSWMNVTEENINNVNLTIAVNTDNLNVSKAEVPYGESVEVSDPCDETKTITVDNVMLNVAKLNGYIGYYVGAELLTTSDNVTIGDENNNPITLSNFVTAGDVCYLDNVDFLVLDPNEDVPAEINVSVIQSNLTFSGHNDSYDYIYLVTGKFRISQSDPVTP